MALISRGRRSQKTRIVAHRLWSAFIPSSVAREAGWRRAAERSPTTRWEDLAALLVGVAAGAMLGAAVTALVVWLVT
jgi:hypothetical protein